MRILAVDPSTTCSGWAVIENGKVLASGSTRGKSRKDLAERTEIMAEQIHGGQSVAGDIDRIVIESFSRKRTARQARQNIADQMTYAWWAGYLSSLLRTLMEKPVEFVPADTWTRQTPKPKRLARLRLEGHKFKTPDEGDAIGIGLWWDRRDHQRSLESRIIGSSAGGPSLPGVEA